MFRVVYPDGRFRWKDCLRNFKIHLVENILIKISLAVLFLLCLFDMPYGYFQFVRLAGLIWFSILTYQENQQCKQTKIIIYGGLALLFQPIFKIALVRQILNIVVVVVAVGLLFTISIKQKNKQPWKQAHLQFAQTNA
mgnify:CR=1 FL=1